MIMAVVIFWPLVQYYYYSNNYQRVGRGPVTFQLSPAVVRPGDSLTLKAHFSRSYDNGLGDLTGSLQVLDRSGQNIMQTLTPLLSEAGYTSTTFNQQSWDQAVSAVALSIRDKAGIIESPLLKALDARRDNPKAFIVEPIGCAIGLGPPTGPPTSYTDDLALTVLPKTPPGQYTVRINPGMYCNGLPPISASLTLIVQ